MQLESSVTLFDDTKVETRFAELQITADGITSEVSKKVGNDEIISRINQSAEEVKIQASRVNIEGATIFSEGRLSENSLDSAYDANGSATGAVADLKSDLSSSSGTTVINGGHIDTGTLDANTINASSGTFSEANIPNLSANKIKASVITAVNNSTETSGGSELKISANKVNIEGAAIFTTGRLSTTKLNNAYDANGAASDALEDAKDYVDDKGYQTASDVETAVRGKAHKNDAVARQQRIYYRKTAAGAPGKNTTWLSTSGTGYGNWSLKIPPLTNG